MGFFGQLLGTDQAKAAQQASVDTYNKQQSAVAKLLGYGDAYANDMADLSNNYAGYTQAGNQFSEALSRLLSDPNSIRSMPGYGFQQEEGMRGLTALNAARGTLNSGAATKDALRFSQGLADSTYGSYLDRFMNGSKMGLGAEALRTNTIGTGLQGNFDAQKTAYQGDMNSAGTIGQGIIAGANAQSAGAQNILNAGMKLGGWLFGK